MSRASNITYEYRLRPTHVEARTQGEHKLARGYEPVVTTSAHHLAHPGLSAAVEDYLAYERRAVEREVEVLGAHVPFWER